MHVLIWFQLLLLFPIAFTLLLTAAGHGYSRRYFAGYRTRFPRPDNSLAPAASIVLPIKGVDDHAEENLRRLCRQEYAGDYELVVAVEEEDDPVLPLVRQIMQEESGCPVHLVMSGSHSTRAAGKLRNMIAGLDAAGHDRIVFVDSDVVVEPDFLATHLPALELENVGLACGAPVAVGPEDWVAAMHNMAVNDSLLIYGANAATGRTEGAVGAAMFTRRDRLATMGGLEQFHDRIVGIDVTLGRAMTRVGFRVHLLSRPIRTRHNRDTLPRLWWQLHRWLVTIRHYVPGFAPVALLTLFPLWWALLFAGMTLWLGGGTGAAFAPFLGVAALRLLSVAAINRAYARDPQLWPYLWCAIPLDLLQFPIFLHSLVSDRVLWRGRWLKLDAGKTAHYLADDETV